jgi:hypothetical protein
MRKPTQARAPQPDLKLLSEPFAHRHQELNAPPKNLTLMQAATFYCLPLQPHKQTLVSSCRALSRLSSRSCGAKQPISTFGSENK